MRTNNIMAKRRGSKHYTLH